MLSPFTEDDKKNTQDSIGGVMNAFTTGYVKGFGVYTVKKVKDGEPEEKPRALDEPDESANIRKEGWLSKEGAIVKSWKRRFFRVLPDWSLSYSENDKSKKIKGTLSLGGYTVVDHEKKENTIILKPSDPDRRTWMVTADNVQEFKDWKAVLRQCARKAPNPLHKDAVRRKAFQKSYLDLYSTFGWWKPYSFDCTGNEVEMLSWFTMRELKWSVLSSVLGRLKGPDMIKNKLAAGVKKTMKTMVTAAATSTFKLASEALDKAQPTVEKKVGDMIGPVKELDKKIESTIKEKLMPAITPVAEKTVTPALEKLLPSLIKPLAEAAAEVIKCFCTVVDDKGMDCYSKVGKSEMSNILYHNMLEFRKPLAEMMSSSGPVWEICKKLQADNAPPRGERDEAGDAGDSGGSLYYFDEYATEKYQDLLRNALYSVEAKDNKDAKVTGVKLCQDLLVVMTELIQEFLTLLFQPIFVVKLGDVLKTITAPIDEMVPEPLQDIVSAGEKVDNCLNLILSELLAGAVSKSAPSGYELVLKAFSSVKHGGSAQIPDVLGGSGKTIRRTGGVSSEEKKDEVKKEDGPVSPTAEQHQRVVIMVKKAGEDEAVAVEIERGRGMTVANFKAAAAAKLKLEGAPADLTFQSPAHPEFNNNDAKLAEVLDGFDEEDHVLEVTSSHAADKSKSEMKSTITNDPTNDKNLPLAARKNFKEYEKQRDDNLKSLQDSLGFALTLNCDYQSLNKASTDRGYENRCGEVVWGSLLEHLANAIKKFCQDDLCKETLVDAIKGKKTVIIRTNDTETLPTYNNLRVRDGELVLEFKSDNYWCNVDSIDGADGLKMLESTL